MKGVERVSLEPIKQSNSKKNREIVCDGVTFLNWVETNYQLEHVIAPYRCPLATDAIREPLQLLMSEKVGEKHEKKRNLGTAPNPEQSQVWSLEAF